MGGIPINRIHQIGIVVKDIQKTMESYSSTFGIGPFRVVECASLYIVVLRYCLKGVGPDARDP